MMTPVPLGVKSSKKARKEIDFASPIMSDSRVTQKGPQSHSHEHNVGVSTDDWRNIAITLIDRKRSVLHLTTHGLSPPVLLGL